jgi:MFS family permease
MRENWYRQVLFASMGLWIGGVAALAGGVGAVALVVGPWWAGVAIGLASGVVGGYVGARTTYRPSIHDRLHGIVGVVLFAGVPVALLLGVLAYVVVASTPNERVVSSLFAGGIAATVGGFLALVANVPLWKARIQDSSTVYASWSARQPPTQRRRTKYAAGAFAVVVVAATVGAFFVDVGVDGTWWMVFAPLTAVLASVDSERTVEVRDAGVLVDSSLVAWDDYDSFELTDEALVLHRASRYVDRTQRFDREDVDDLDEAVRALERFLDRRES